MVIPEGASSAGTELLLDNRYVREYGLKHRDGRTDRGGWGGPRGGGQRLAK